MMDICLLGSGGMMPLPNRFLTALMMRYNGHSLLIDCGEGTQVALRKRGWSFKPIDTVCFTHYHGDHISGLPGLLLTMGNAERSEPLLMIGPKGLERVVGCLRVIAPELPFEIRYHELNENEETIDLGQYRLKAFKVLHSIPCYGYSVEIDRAGRFDAERAKQQQIPLPYWNRLQKGETIEAEGRRFTPDMVLGPPRKGLKMTYVTDTRPTEAIVRGAAGSDLFICEGMYGEPDKKENAYANRHMMIMEAAEMARRAGVSEMWLTHYSPSMVHPEEFLEEARTVFPGTILGKDGKTVTLTFTEE